MKCTSDDIPCYYIGHRLRLLGIIVTDMKEKMGTWRVYCHFGLDSLHDITHNGYAYIQYQGRLRDWYFKTLKLQSLLLRPVNYILFPIQRKWYRQVYRMAIRKFPCEAEAILMGADHTELLLGLDKRLVIEDNRTIRWRNK